MRIHKALSWALLLACFGCAAKQGAFIEVQSPTAFKPDIQMNWVGDSLSARKIQVDVHGAELGVELRFVGPNARNRFFSCTVSKTTPYQRWECRPTIDVEEDCFLSEAGCFLEVEARSKHSNTVGRFAWNYEARGFWLENKEAWERDDALYVQLEGNKNVDWEKAELFVGENKQQRAVRSACPPNLPVKLHAECFKVSLSAFPDLPHGKYVLHLTANLVDASGNLKSHRRSFDIRINRRLWNLALRADWSAVTREGWLLLLTANPNKEGERLTAINAAGEKVWSAELPGLRRGLLLGNHRGLDVVIANCHNEKEEEEKRKGFHAVHAKTGEVLFSDCTDSIRMPTFLTLLQSGSDKDLVVLRQSLKGADHLLEVCRFGRPNASSPWGFQCDESILVSKKEGIGWAVRTPEGARVFVGSLKHHWCALEWKDKKGWSQGCVAQGPHVAGSDLSSAYICRLGSEHLWAFYLGEGGNKMHEWVQSFNLKTGLGIARDVFFWNSWVPPLVDSQDEWIVPIRLSSVDAESKTSTVRPLIQRYSADGNLLFERDMLVGKTSIALMEGGNFLLPGKDFGLACLKPDFSDCWEGAAEADGEGDFLGVLPLSPTRSIVVLGYEENRVSAFLVDTPGLKKDAPWPIYGHDLCRSNNLSVPVDNCWEGPKL